MALSKISKCNTAMGAVEEAIVPTIDVGALFGDDLAAKKKVAAQIWEVSRPNGLGFFFASGHGVDLLDELLAVTRAFYGNLTKEEKQELAVSGVRVRANKPGYHPAKPGREAAQALVYGNPAFTPSHPAVAAATPLYETNIWPNGENHSDFRRLHELFYAKVTKLTTALLQGYALALGKPENFFEDFFKAEDTLSFVRLVHCPYMPGYEHPAAKAAEDGTGLSVMRHVDPSLITVIYQPQVANLQAVQPDGTILDIPTSDDCFLVNAGGYMDVVTNGYFAGPPHRVKFVNVEGGRFAMPYFVMLGYDTVIPPFNPVVTNGKNFNGVIGNGNLGKKYGEWFVEAQKVLSGSKAKRNGDGDGGDRAGGGGDGKMPKEKPEGEEGEGHDQGQG